MKLMLGRAATEADLLQMNGFDLFAINILNMLSLNVVLLGARFDLTICCLCYRVLSF